MIDMPFLKSMMHCFRVIAFATLLVLFSKRAAFAVDENSYLREFAGGGWIENCWADKGILEVRDRDSGRWRVRTRRDSKIDRSLKRAIEDGECFLPEFLVYNKDNSLVAVHDLIAELIADRIADLMGELKVGTDRECSFRSDFGYLVTVQGEQFQFKSNQMLATARQLTSSPVCRELLTELGYVVQPMPTFLLVKFQVVSLETTFEGISRGLYSQKSRFILSAAELIRSLPVETMPMTYGGFRNYIGRLFVLNVIRPIITGTNSEVFLTEVHPAYIQAVGSLNEENGIKSFHDFSASPEVLRASVTLLVAAIRESKDFVSSTELDRRAIERILAAAGTALASKLKNRHDLTKLMTALDEHRSLLKIISANRHTRELGQVAQSIAEYLAGI